MTLNPVILGQQDVSFNSLSIYSTIRNMDSYLWSLTGGTIQYGQGTNAVDVLLTTTGTIAVKCVNGVDSGTTILDINVPV